MRTLKTIPAGSSQAAAAGVIPAAPSRQLATSAEDISKALYEFKGFTREAALQAFANVKRRSR